MQIGQTPNPSVITPGNTGNASAVDGSVLGREQPATATPVDPSPTTAAPLRRGLTNWDQSSQDDISGAQQALDFLEQSAGQLRSLKADLSSRLASRQRSDGSLDARVRQFSNTWRNRQAASGGTLDPRLNFSNKQSTQRFTVRGMSLAHLRSGGREVLAMSTGTGSSLRSVSLEPGLSDDQIAQRFDEALAPAGVRVAKRDDGNLEFSTAEATWTNVRDGIAVQGSGIRFPGGQLNRVKAEAEAPAVNPDSWQTSDQESVRVTLQQVVQALAQVEASMSSVKAKLSQASTQIEEAAPDESTAGMDQVAQNFVSTTKQSGYQSLLSITSALAGISRERVVALLGLR